MKKKILKSADLQEPWVEAFKVGKVTDMAGNEHDFSESDLDELNKGIHTQLDSGYQPPMVKGHPKVDDPRVASIVDSKVDGKVLKVKLDDVDPDFAEEVKKGGFKYLSAAVYSKLGKGLRHLGALGAVGPAMKGMAPLCFGEGMFAEADKGSTEQDVSVFAEAYAWDRLVPSSAFSRLIWRLEGLGRLFRSQREQIIEKESIEAADRAMPDYIVKDMESLSDLLKDANQFPEQPKNTPHAEPAKDSSFAEGDEEGKGGEGSEGEGEGAPANNDNPGSDPLENGGQNPQTTTPQPTEPTAVPTGNPVEGDSTDAARLSEENAALKAENDALKADKLAAERLRASAAFSETLDGAIAEGRCNQVMKDSLLKVFGAFQMVPVDGEGCFGEGEERVNPMDLLKETVKAMPKIVEFGESQIFKGKDETPAVRIEKYRAEQKAKGRVITFAEAAEECVK